MKLHKPRSIKIYLPIVRCGEVHLIIEVLSVLEAAYDGLCRWNLIMKRAEDEEGIQYRAAPRGKLDKDLVIPEEDSLCLARIEVIPPAYLEIAGQGQVLESLHAYLASGETGRNRSARDPDEERRALERRRLKPVRLQVELLKALGYPEFEIRSALTKYVAAPLNRLDRLNGLALYDEMAEAETRLSRAGER